MTFDTEQAKTERILIPDAFLRSIPAALAMDLLEAGNIEGAVRAKGGWTVPLSSCRVTGASNGAILETAAALATRAGIADPSAAFRFNSAKLRRRTIPVGKSSLLLLRPTLVYDAALYDVVPVPMEKPPRKTTSVIGETSR